MNSHAFFWHQNMVAHKCILFAKADAFAIMTVHRSRSMNASAASPSTRSCRQSVAACVRATGSAFAQPYPKKNGEAIQSRSPGTRCWRVAMAWPLRTSPSWRSATVFGSAVLPLVNRTRATSSGRTTTAGARAPATTPSGRTWSAGHSRAPRYPGPPPENEPP